MPSSLVPLTCAVAALAVGGAGCGEDRDGSVEPSGGGTDTTGTTAPGDTSTSPARSGGTPAATVKVKETEYTLHPENPKVGKVGLVKFEIENAGTLTHALEVEGPGGEVETEGIEAGKSATLEADLSKPGTYTWYCPIADHETRGMKGRITVAGGGSSTERDDSAKRGGSSGKSGSSGKPGDPPTGGGTSY
ncbi:MAG: cupredoxin domain-containing protein [Thermoleophilaceae bacterium]